MSLPERAFLFLLGVALEATTRLYFWLGGPPWGPGYGLDRDA